MIEIILLGFILGFLMPITASRFGKVLPADPGMILLRLWHRPHFPKTGDVYRARLLRKKWMKLWGYSVLWGVIMAVLFGLTPVFLNPVGLWLPPLFESLDLLLLRFYSLELCLFLIYQFLF